MRSLFISALLQAFTEATNFEDYIPSCSSWTTVEVNPPPEECCTSDWTDDATCAVIQNAVDAASACTKLELTAERIYCNKLWYKMG